jgi:hypothetical protein
MNNIAKIEVRAERIGAQNALAISTETFSESFSNWVKNCLSKQCQSTLNLFVKSLILHRKMDMSRPIPAIGSIPNGECRSGLGAREVDGVHKSVHKNTRLPQSSH